MPLTRKRRSVDESTETDKGSEERNYTTFVHKARWFVVSQTHGSETGPITIPEWDAERALKMLCIERITFDKTDGNCQGFARGKQIAIIPVAQLRHKTLFHEMAHVILHTSEGDFTDTEQTPRNLREVEAESVALLCSEALGLEGANFHEAISKTGSIKESDTTPMRSPKRAPRRFSVLAIKSCEPDDRPKSEQPNPRTDTQNEKGQLCALTLPDPTHQLFNRDRRKTDANKL